MKKIALWVLSVVLCIYMVSCSKAASYESQADSAYNQSKHAQGYEKKMLEKRAYIFYQKTLHEVTDRKKMSLSFIQHFLDITLNRARMVLDEGQYNSDAVRLFTADIDTILNKDSPLELRQRYADFLSTLADSCLIHSQINESLDWITKATTVVDNPSSLMEKKKLIINDFCKQNFEMAKAAFDESKANKDPEQAVKAEYYVLLTLVFDPNFPGAAPLLSELRKVNVNVYSGYAKMVEGKLDKRVNKYDIMLAISKNAKTSMTVAMFNNSYNPQRLKAENFYLVDDKGKKFAAGSGSKLEPEILDTQHETKTLHLVFPGATGTIKKLVYENGEHHSEKELY